MPITINSFTLSENVKQSNENVATAPKRPMILNCVLNVIISLYFWDLRIELVKKNAEPAPIKMAAPKVMEVTLPEFSYPIIFKQMSKFEMKDRKIP